MTDEPLLYVYAVVRSADAQGPPTDPPPDVTLGGGLTTVEHRGLTAVVEPVPAADFAEAPLRERLEDLDWLAVVARAHHAVVGATSRRTTTVPLRLATVRRGESGVRRFLEEGESGLSEALGRLTGTHEWGVELYADEAPGDPVAGGADDTAARAARELHETLARAATEAVLRAPRRAHPAGEPGRNVLNAVYLVPDEGRRDFLDVLPGADDVRPGLRMEITGPRAPHSFARVGPDEELEW
ncbi:MULTISPECIES: GvpL/GvpF family gas vesicle protein [unclassified Streptomyces]|uniref:GvpL/GvpF family gas vesicle protein n=1 Tax=unclassified Streptomyces TaxID=2593676 RepID=UPI00339FD5B3